MMMSADNNYPRDPSISMSNNNQVYQTTTISYDEEIPSMGTQHSSRPHIRYYLSPQLQTRVVSWTILACGVLGILLGIILCVTSLMSINSEEPGHDPDNGGPGLTPVFGLLLIVVGVILLFVYFKLFYWKLGGPGARILKPMKNLRTTKNTSRQLEDGEDEDVGGDAHNNMIRTNPNATMTIQTESEKAKLMSNEEAKETNEERLMTGETIQTSMTDPRIVLHPNDL